MILTFTPREVFARLSSLIVVDDANRANSDKDGGFHRHSRSVRNRPVLRALEVASLAAIFLGCSASSEAMMASPASSSSPQPTPSINNFICKSSTVLGAATDSCVLYLSTATSQAMTITLSSSNPAVTMPATVTVPANASNVQFTANLASVATTQTALITASAGVGTKSCQLTLLQAVSKFVLATPTLTFPGYVPLNSSVLLPVYVISTGTVPLTISAATVSGAGFQVSGATFPMTLNPGQKGTIEVQFNPTVAGSATGQVKFVTNSSTGTQTTTLSALGGAPPISSLFCKNSSALGAATDTCSVYLTAAQAVGVTTVALSSSNPALTVPATVTIPAKSNNAQFTVNVASVGTLQKVVMTASTSANSKTYDMTLFQAVSTLIIQNPTVALGYVPLNGSASQSISILSAGSMPVTISAANVTGAGFQVTGATFPMTLNAGQKATIEVQFTPTVVGSVTGQLTLISNSSTGNKVANLSAKGSAVGKFPGTVVNTVVSPNPTTPISSDLFGMTVYWLASKTAGAKNLTPFPPYPVSTLRLWDVDYWANIEWRSGTDDWSKMDGDVAVGQKNGVKDILFTFGQPPNWASSNPSDPCPGGEGPGTCAMPDMNAYDAFATKVVQRYCGKIKYYEPWNEPNNSLFWDGTNTQLLTIAQHLYGIAKDPANCGCTNGSCSPNGGANPNQVLLPPIAGLDPPDIAWLDAYLAAANSTPYADVASFHGYVWHGYPPEQIVSGVQALKQTLGKYGLGNLELWNSETSFETNTYYSAEQQTSWLMRTYTMEAALGVSRLAWYSYDSCTWGTLFISPLCPNNQSPANQLTQGGNAYGTIQNWLTGANITQCQQYQSGLWACELQRPNNYDAWMLWSSNGTTLTVAVPSNLGLATSRDLQNGVNALPSEVSVSDLPILLEN